MDGINKDVNVWTAENVVKKRMICEQLRDKRSERTMTEDSVGIDGGGCSERERLNRVSLK